MEGKPSYVTKVHLDADADSLQQVGSEQLGRVILKCNRLPRVILLRQIHDALREEHLLSGDLVDLLAEGGENRRLDLEVSAQELYIPVVEKCSHMLASCLILKPFFCPPAGPTLKFDLLLLSWPWP